MLEVKSLTKKLPIKETPFSTQKVQVLDDVSFSLDEGETLGIVGESGCGKTTLALVCAGLLKPSGGSVYCKGVDIYSRKAGNNIGLIFQNASGSLNRRWTIERIVREPLVIKRVAGKDSLTEEVFVKAGMNYSDKDKYPSELSGGQLQRVAIARALITAPELLILDEPVSSLDVSMQAQIINLLADIQEKESLSYIFISHDLRLVSFISTHIAVMYLGKIIEKALVQDFINHPWHPYSKALLSAVILPDPRVEKKRELSLLKGEVPSLVDRPKGCVFNTRCAEAKSICFKEEPQLKELGSGKLVACHLKCRRQI